MEAVLLEARRNLAREYLQAPRWREAVRERPAQIEWRAVEKDLAPSLERPGDLRHLSPEGIDKLLVAKG